MGHLWTVVANQQIWHLTQEVLHQLIMLHQLDQERGVEVEGCSIN